jgi:hypothetical protein
MRELDVFISDKDRRGFIRRALRFYHKDGSEHIEGAVVRMAVGQYHIERLVRLKILRRGVDEDGFPSIEYCPHDFAAKKAAAEADGLKFITIHSHPNCDSSPSKCDHISGVKDGEILVGVLEVWEDDKKRIRTSLDFWIPQLPCKVNVLKEK